jgi:PEGA domain
MARHATVPDAIEGFKSESDLAAALRRQQYLRWGLAALGVVVLSTSAVVGLRGGTSNASIQIQSKPVGIQVRINGEVRGRTPLALSLAPGTYDVVLGEGDSAERHQVVLADDEKSSLQYVLRDNPGPAAAAASASAVTSALSVITEPAGGAISIDGVDRGTAPMLVEHLSAGAHRLVVRNQGAVYQRAVTLRAGETSTVVVGTSVAAAAGGWLTVQTPLPMQIHEAGGLIGLTETSRLMLSPGDHQLTLSDEKTGFRVSRVVRITPGQTTTLAVEVPRSSVNFNAIPWAEVWIDGERAGETPIGNAMLPLGNHQIELRHPQLGTKRLTLSVSLNGPNRVAVNMRDR